MKKSLMALCAATALQIALAPAAFAGAQQERMKTCNKEAKSQALKGDARKSFMKTCLSTRKQAPASATPTAAKGE